MPLVVGTGNYTERDPVAGTEGSNQGWHSDTDCPADSNHKSNDNIGEHSGSDIGEDRRGSSVG